MNERVCNKTYVLPIFPFFENRLATHPCSLYFWSGPQEKVLLFYKGSERLLVRSAKNVRIESEIVKISIESWNSTGGYFSSE